MAKKKSKINELRQVQALIGKMRTAIRDSQRELDKADKAAKGMKKLFEASTRKPVKDNKKKE